MFSRRTLLIAASAAAGIASTFRSCRAQISGALAAGDMRGTGRSLPAIRQTGGKDFSSISLLQLPIGGGGFVTGIDASTDGGRFVCRTDVANAYVRNASDRAWLPLFSPMTMDPEDYGPWPALKDKADGLGVAGVRIAPSNRNRIYAGYCGYIWRSDDGGRSIRRTGSPQLAMLANSGEQRLYNRTIDVDHRNADRVIVGTFGNDGMWYSLDGGSKWRKANLPPPAKSLDDRPGIHLVLFDAKVDGRVFVFVTGQGLFRSDVGPGGTFQLVEGTPKFAASLLQGADGAIFLTEQTKADDGLLWRLGREGRWSALKPGRQIRTIAIHPRASAQMIGSDGMGRIQSSEDGGQTWQARDEIKWHRSRGEVGWMRDLNLIFPAQMIFDPANPDRLLIANGVGVAESSGLSFPLQVADWSAGIEELCAMDVMAVPGGKLFLSAMDKSFWRVDSRNTYTNSFRSPGPAGRDQTADPVAFASYMDYAGDDPRFIVGVIAPSELTAPGFSADGGDSWSTFPGTPPKGWGYGGCIAASTRNNIVLLPSNNEVGCYTLDGGRTWESIRLDGTNPTGGFANAYYVRRKNLAADKTRPGTFALVYTTIKDNGFNEPLGGVWVTRDGGGTWTQTLKGLIAVGNTNPRTNELKGLDPRQFWQCQIEYVPRRPGELIYTPYADYKDERFYWSRDDGKTWRELHKSVRNVKAFGFGKASPEATFPAVYFWGQVDGTEGLYGSFDWLATNPRLITKYPSQMLGKVEVVEGDPDHLGRVYVGTHCAGWIQVDTAP